MFIISLIHSCSHNREKLCNRRDSRMEECESRTPSATGQETATSARVWVLLFSSRVQVWLSQGSDFLVMDRNPWLMTIMVRRKNYPP